MDIQRGLVDMDLERFGVGLVDRQPAPKAGNGHTAAMVSSRRPRRCGIPRTRRRVSAFSVDFARGLPAFVFQPLTGVGVPVQSVKITNLSGAPAYAGPAAALGHRTRCPRASRRTGIFTCRIARLRCT